MGYFAPTCVLNISTMRQQSCVRGVFSVIAYFVAKRYEVRSIVRHNYGGRVVLIEGLKDSAWLGHRKVAIQYSIFLEIPTSRIAIDAAEDRWNR